MKLILDDNVVPISRELAKEMMEALSEAREIMSLHPSDLNRELKMCNWLSQYKHLFEKENRDG